MLRRLLAALCGCALLSGPAFADPATSLAPFRDAMSRETQGRRFPAYDGFHDRWMRRLPAPMDVLGVEPRLLAQAQKIVAARAQVVGAPTMSLPSRKAGRAPLAPFAVFYESLRGTFERRLGLAPDVAAALAAEIERQSIETAGVDPARYYAALGVSRPDSVAIAAALRTATDQLWRQSRVDHAYEVPYVAGYDRDAGEYVFVDCAVPLATERNGRILPVGPLLVIHERVEKAMLQDYRTVYPSAHQIALRIEKAAAAALGVEWKAYDDLITELSDAISARTQVRDVSARLDLQPYYTFLDADNRKLVAGIEKALTPHVPHAAPGPDLPTGAACPSDGGKP